MKYCKDCQSLSSRQVTAKQDEKWCCKYGKPAKKATGQCKLTNGKEQSDVKLYRLER